MELLAGPFQQKSSCAIKQNRISCSTQSVRISLELSHSVMTHEPLLVSVFLKSHLKALKARLLTFIFQRRHHTHRLLGPACIVSLCVLCKLLIGWFPTRGRRRDVNLRERLRAENVTRTQTAGRVPLHQSE